MGSNESSEANGMNETKPTETGFAAQALVEKAVTDSPASQKEEERTGAEQTAAPQKTQEGGNAGNKLPRIPSNKENDPVGCNAVADTSAPQTPQKLANKKQESSATKSTDCSLNQTEDVKLEVKTTVPQVNPPHPGNVTQAGPKEVNRKAPGNDENTSSPAKSTESSNQVGEQSKTQPTETNRPGPAGQKNKDSTPVNPASVVPSSLPKQEAGSRTVPTTEVSRPDSSDVKSSPSQKQGTGPPVKNSDQKAKTGSMLEGSKQPRVENESDPTQAQRAQSSDEKPGASSVTSSQSPTKSSTDSSKPSVPSAGAVQKSTEATSQVAKTSSTAGKLDDTPAEPPRDLENDSSRQDIKKNGNCIPAEGPHSSADSGKSKTQSPAERPLSGGLNWNEINWEEISETMNPFVHGNKIPLKSAENSPPPMLEKPNSEAKPQKNPQPNLGDIINKSEDIQSDKNTSSATETISEQNVQRKPNSLSESGTVTVEPVVPNSCEQPGLKQNLPSGPDTSEQKKAPLANPGIENPLRVHSLVEGSRTSAREDRPVSAGVDWTKINWDEVGEDFNPFEKFNGHPPHLPTTKEGDDENSEQDASIKARGKSPTPIANSVDNSASKPNQKSPIPDPTSVPVRTQDKPAQEKNAHSEDFKTSINPPQMTQRDGESDKKSPKTSDEKRGDVDERPLSKGIDWSEINWDEIDENFNPFGKADGIVNQPKSAVKTQPASGTSGSAAPSGPKDNKQIPRDKKPLQPKTNLDKKNKVIAKSSAVDKKSPLESDGVKAPPAGDEKEDVPVKAVIPTRNDDSKHETLQRQQSRSDIPVGGTGAYNINWDEVDEMSDPFGGKLSTVAKKKVSENTGANVPKSTDKTDSDKTELTSSSNKQVDGHSDQLNKTEPKTNKQTKAAKPSASLASKPSRSETKSQTKKRPTTDAGSEGTKEHDGKSGDKVNTMEERPLNTGGYNINWDEIDEMSNPFGKSAPPKPKTPVKSSPKVNSSGDGPGPKALGGDLNSHSGNQANANLADENEALENSKPESELSHDESSAELPGLAPSSGAPAPEELAQALENVASDQNEGPGSDEQDEMTGSVLNPLPPSNRDTSDQVPTLGRVDSSTRPASPAHPNTLARPSMDVGNVANGHSSPEDEIAALKKERDELRTTVDEMRRCIAEYDRSLQHLVEEKSQNQTQVNVSVADLITERDQAVEEVATIEKAFGDLHRRFEKSKQIIEGYKQNEEVLKKSIEEYKQLLQRQETKYLALKKLAEEKLLKATQDTENAKQEFESQAARLQAALRLAELQTKSLESQLEQKTRENAELTKICDELLSKYGGGT